MPTPAWASPFSCADTLLRQGLPRPRETVTLESFDVGSLSKDEELVMDCSSAQPPESTGHAVRPQLTKEQQAVVFQAACRRVTAAVHRQRGQSTRELLGEAAETAVYGAFVTLRREGRLRSCCGHIESTVPLWHALDRAADRAATDDPRFPPIQSSELRQLHVDVWILWGPEQITARGEDRAQAVTIGKHGLQIARGHARGLLLPGVAVEHGFDARTFLEQVCLKAGLPTDAWKDDATDLWRFEGEAIEGPMQVEVIEDRPAAVAGGFYPGDPRGIQESLDRLFAFDAPQPQPFAGAMTPHAGWVYSGRLAATVLSRVAIPDHVIVLCPKHRPGGADWAVAPHRRWLFPGGQLDSDPDLAARLAEGVPGLELDATAHRGEWAIEVQLPFLARLAPKTRVVGITVGDSPLAELLRFGIALSVVLRDMPVRPLLLISSDMNHYADEQRTRLVDRLALDAIATLDPERVYDTVRGNGISMCGLGPCVIVMEALRWLGSLNRCESVGYTTSAEASGDTNRVVGYAGLLFN
jgi:AmmeMemoRadiSam system protein B/AmmeMemoRadiSam system protein A